MDQSALGPRSTPAKVNRSSTARLRFPSMMQSAWKCTSASSAFARRTPTLKSAGNTTPRDASRSTTPVRRINCTRSTIASPMAAAPRINSGDVRSRVNTKAITIPGRTACARPSLTSASRLNTRNEPASAHAAAVTAAMRMVHSSITWPPPPSSSRRMRARARAGHDAPGGREEDRKNEDQRRHEHDHGPGGHPEFGRADQRPRQPAHGSERRGERDHDGQSLRPLPRRAGRRDQQRDHQHDAHGLEADDDAEDEEREEEGVHQARPDAETHGESGVEGVELQLLPAQREGHEPQGAERADHREVVARHRRRHPEDVVLEPGAPADRGPAALDPAQQHQPAAEEDREHHAQARVLLDARAVLDRAGEQQRAEPCGDRSGTSTRRDLEPSPVTSQESTKAPTIPSSAAWEMTSPTRACRLR